jgi:site-specific recombinase XerD
MSSELESAISNPREWLQNKLTDPNFEATLIRRGYLEELYAFSDWRAGRSLTKQLVDDYYFLLQRSGYSPLSVKRALNAVGWWLASILETSPEDEEPDRLREEIGNLVTLLNSSRSPQASPPNSTNRISKAQLLSIMQVCSRDSAPKNLRDAAVVALLIATDIGYASLSRLTIYNVRSNGATGHTLSYQRKDKEEQTVDLPASSSKFLSNWLGFRGQNLGPLFYEIKGSERVLWGHAMTESSVRMLLKSRLEEAKSIVGQPAPVNGP